MCYTFKSANQLFALERVTEPRETLASIVFFKYYKGLSVVPYTVISAGGSRKFKSILVYIVSSRPIWATERENKQMKIVTTKEQIHRVR